MFIPWSSQRDKIKNNTLPQTWWIPFSNSQLPLYEVYMLKRYGFLMLEPSTVVDLKKQKVLSISTLLVGGSYTNYTVVIANLLTVTKYQWIVSLLLDLFFLLSPTILLPEDYMSMSFSLFCAVFCFQFESYGKCFCWFYSGVHIIRSLILCVCFVDRSLSFCIFSFGHCVVCPSIFGFWLPRWYLHTLLARASWLSNLDSPCGFLWRLFPIYFMYSFLNLVCIVIFLSSDIL